VKERDKRNLIHVQEVFSISVELDLKSPFKVVVSCGTI